MVRGEKFPFTVNKSAGLLKKAFAPLLVISTYHYTSYLLFCLDVPVYLSSQSYMADSSLSEEMSQFDFSTGVQSFSYNSQNALDHSRTKKTQVGASDE